MKIIFFLSSLFVLFSLVYAQQSQNYDYQTELKGGYSISFKEKGDMQYLYLVKGRKTIAELSSASKVFLQKNLGYVGADFNDYFVLVHSFGSGNPHEIEIIHKQTGKNILNKTRFWVDVDNKRETVLYSLKGVPNKKDKMILLNMKTMKRNQLAFPTDIIEHPMIHSSIEIYKLTDKKLIIKYETEKGYKTKVYNL